MRYVRRRFFLNLDEFSEVSDGVNASQGIKLIWSTVNLNNPWSNEVNMDLSPRYGVNVTWGKVTISSASYFVSLTSVTIEIGDDAAETWVVISNE